MIDDTPMFRIGRDVFGPRASVMRHLLGETVTETDVLTDTSEFGWWPGSYTGIARPPELWVGQIGDFVGGCDE